MRFVVDAQLPPALAAWLRDKGHIAETVREIGLRDADDDVIWSYASGIEAVIVTKDEDFALLSARSDRPRVLWIRFGNVLNRVLLRRLEAAWPEVESHLGAGACLVELR